MKLFIMNIQRGQRHPQHLQILNHFLITATSQRNLPRFDLPNTAPNLIRPKPRTETISKSAQLCIRFGQHHPI